MDNSEKLNVPDVPYLVHEEELTRMERNVKRWVIGWLITFLALIITNIGWVVYESQYQDVVTTVSQETSSEGGGDAIINGNNAGAVIYGESKADGNN